MAKQYGLFGSNRPIARATDPATSHLAAAEITASGLRAAQSAEVLRALLADPGTTSRELAQRARLDRHMVARRLPELRGARQGEARTCSISGRLALTWWPT